MARLSIVGLLFLATPAFAEEFSLLYDEVESAASRSYTEHDPVDLDPNLHALFYQAEPDTFIISFGVWWARLTGPVTFDNGVDLDVSETLGLRARKTVPFVRAGWRIGWFSVLFEGFWYDNTGTQVVEEEFEINDVVFEVGDVIESVLKIHSYRLTLAFTLMQRDWITLNFQLGAGALYTEGKVEAVNVNKKATWDQWLPLPMVAIAAKGYFIKYPWIYEAEFGWIGFSNRTFGATAIDARLAFGYHINDWLNAKVGYRYFGIDAEIDQVKAEIAFSGFYIEVAFMF
ncbi:MAG: porin family protein [Planctomycetota bacterium]|jgi:hypothetical protein